MTLVKDAPAPAGTKAKPATLGWTALLTHVEPLKAAQPRIEAAAALAKRFDALLIGLGAELTEPVTFADPYGGWDGQVLIALREQVQADLAQAQARFKAAAAGVRHEFRSVEDKPVPAMARVARGADLIVAGGRPLDDGNGYRNADVAELALTAGRPVLVVPPKGGALKAETVIVAWKDTRESRRALADALPLLVAAKDVLVIEVTDGPLTDAEFHVTDIAEALKRHGVAARGIAVAGPNDKVAGLLQAEADIAGADLIVAGCYGHSRANEWFFGGVTSDLLSNPRRFLLLSH